METQEKEQYGINANETNNSKSGEEKNYELVEVEKLNGTPFTMVRQETNGWFGTMGDHRVSHGYETKKELKKYLESKDWDLITIVMSIIIQKTDELKRQVVINEWKKGEK